MPSTALKSLYGGKTAAAKLAGNVGGQEREQTVFTPLWLVKELRLWASGHYNGAGTINYVEPEQIALDPCTTHENPVGARRYMSDVAPILPNGSALPPFGWVSNDGLQADWSQWTKDRGFAYVNPPYADLQNWLRKAGTEALKGVPIYMLCPWRSNREWFCAALNGKRAASATTISPIAFVGSKSGFPAPLCILTWNLPTPDSISKPAGTARNPGTKEIVTGVFKNSRRWDY